MTTRRPNMVIHLHTSELREFSFVDVSFALGTFAEIPHGKSEYTRLCFPLRM